MYIISYPVALAGILTIGRSLKRNLSIKPLKNCCLIVLFSNKSGYLSFPPSFAVVASLIFIKDQYFQPLPCWKYFQKVEEIDLRVCLPFVDAGEGGGVPRDCSRTCVTSSPYQAVCPPSPHACSFPDHMLASLYSVEFRLRSMEMNLMVRRTSKFFRSLQNQLCLISFVQILLST